MNNGISQRRQISASASSCMFATNVRDTDEQSIFLYDRRAGRFANSALTPSKLSSLKVYGILLTLLISCHFTSGDWIDPDTPKESYTAQPYKFNPPTLPKSKPKKAKKHHNRTKHHGTYAPSFSPTVSEEPSSQPSAWPTEEIHTETYELVFSDEFNTPYRSFADGVDPRWTALDKNDYTNDALHYYSPNNVVTNDNGELVITTEAADTDVIGFDDVKRKKTRVTKHFKSGMVQSWNKFCFTGGIIESEVVLPGKANVGGLWPAFWLLGNLARHTYVGSSEHVWPWSSSVCTKKSGDSQLINACDRIEHYGLEVGLGRGAPEMDIFEVQPGNIKANTGPFLESTVGQPFASASFQVAPGRSLNRPGPGYWPGPGQWYEGLTGGVNSSLNILFYGTYNHFLDSIHPLRQDYWSDAISYNRQLNEDHFERPHKYRLEWELPDDKKDGHLRWYIDNDLVLNIDGKGVKKAGLGSSISTEPSYILFNTAVSKQWGFPLECPAYCPCKEFDCNSHDFTRRCGFSDGFCEMMRDEPPKYRINWVRVYQNPKDEKQKVGCSTPERPTRRFINAHEKHYKSKNDLTMLKGIQTGRGACNPNLTPDEINPQTCGGYERGKCTQGRVCECKKGWTGPHCLVHDGYDPIVYDAPDTIADVGFVPPKVPGGFLPLGFIILVVFLIASISFRQRMDGWTPIPDNKY